MVRLMTATLPVVYVLSCCIYMAHDWGVLDEPLRPNPSLVDSRAWYGETRPSGPFTLTDAAKNETRAGGWGREGCRCNSGLLGYHAKRPGTTLISPTRWHLTLLARTSCFADGVFPGGANATPRHASATECLASKHGRWAQGVDLSWNFALLGTRGSLGCATAEAICAIF